MIKSTQTHTSNWNPDLSIWLSVDPLADKYPSLSPYNYCANNPIKYVDPDGRDFDDAMKVRAKAYENEVGLRIEFLKNKMSNLDPGSKKYNSYNEQIGEYENILNEVNELRNDPNNLYKLNFNKKLGNNIEGSVTYGGENNGQRIINVNLKADSKSEPMLSLNAFSHEMKHAHQYFSGDLGFAIAPDGKIYSNYSKQLEIQAGERGSMFSGNTMTYNNKFNYNFKFGNFKLCEEGFGNLERIYTPDDFKNQCNHRDFKLIFNK